MPRLRDLLLRWLLIPTLVLWAAAFALSYLRGLAQAHEAYDRTLLGSALVVSENFVVADGAIVADLPYAALEMLRTDAQDRIFYRVARLDTGSHITGYADLPQPATPPGVEPVFYDATYKDQGVRIVALRYTLPDAGDEPDLLVQVAETLEARHQLTRRIVTESAALQLLLIAMAAGLIAWGVRQGLAPLKRLRREVRARGAHDLTPIDTRAVPREVAPLIHAINAHTERQRQLSDAQVRFVANASHQLKTPLTVLRAQVDHALLQTDLNAMRSVLIHLDRTTDATGRLVGQLLALARSEPGRTLDVTDVDLVELARDATFELLAAARGKRIDLGFEGNDPVPVRGEAVLLRELVTNLVHNAIVYTPERGKVTVTVALREQCATLTVVDNGPGIAPAERTRVLERFYRAPGSPEQGSGLGLAIAKEICARHGVSMALTDVPDGGIGLCVRLVWPPAGAVHAPGAE
jgi:two-component system sensor histidine kinase TctE